MEKKVAEHCVLLRLDHFLPLREETKVYQRRRVTVQKPVFPGYVFAAFDDSGRMALLKTNSIVRFLLPPSEAEFLHQIEQVRAALAVDPTLGAAAALQKGRMVRITGGSFHGVEGLVDSLTHRTTVWLTVDMIGQAVRVEVDRNLVELID
jgi:transcriptional antiterminator RfaH